MHKLTKATSIPPAVKQIVWRRDYCRCVICGSINAGPHCHFVRRSQLGLGIEENIWTGCTKCHTEFDSEGTDGPLHKIVEEHLKNKYPNWEETPLTYSKYDWRK